jgi:hypothetical protein
VLGLRVVLGWAMPSFVELGWVGLSCCDMEPILWFVCVGFCFWLGLGTLGSGMLLSGGKALSVWMRVLSVLSCHT